MNGMRDGFDHIQFTQEEKQDLTARLLRAAEQEENMTDSTKRKIKKLSRGMIIGIAAALILSVGALAAVVNPGLRSYFDTGALGAQEKLENGIYQLGRSLTYRDWTVALTDCVGDSYRAYIWVEVTAPEGTNLAESEDNWFSTYYLLDGEGVSGPTGGALYTVPDENPSDNRMSFCMEVKPFLKEGLLGSTLNITLEPIEETQLTGTEEEGRQAVKVYERLEDIREHSWVFENVTFRDSDQAIRLEPKVSVPYLGGTAELTYVEITPLTAVIRVEGGACYDHNGRSQRTSEQGKGTEIQAGGAMITVGGDAYQPIDCWNELGLELHMKDGTVLSQLPGAAGSSCNDGIAPYQPGEEYVEGRFLYAEENSNLLPPRIIDPAQVDYVTVCGVDIPVNRAE